MARRFAAPLLSWLTLIGLIFPQNVFSLKQVETPTQPTGYQIGVDYTTLVVQSSHNDVSPALRTLHPISGLQSEPSTLPLEIPNPILPKAIGESEMPTQKGGLPEPDSRNSTPGSPLFVDEMPAPSFSFDGVSNLFGGWPPDTQGDIGPDHYVQWINLHFAIWQIDRHHQTANLVYGPYPGNTLFQGFSGVCATANHGDPITLYDPFDNRWFMSQFALPNYPYGPFYQCVAVSVTSDPTGAWYRYEYQIPVNKMNDYPKFGVWPNAYFMTLNQFNAGSLNWGGAAVAALERSAMLVGAQARMVFIDLYNVNSDYSGILPADFDGRTYPPDGAPGYFAEWDDSSWIGSMDAVRVWEFNVDWSHPDEATFGNGGDPNWVIPTQNVDPNMCGMLRNCIPQPGTSNRVDAISDRLMYRLQYRNFGGYSALVSNHTIDLDGTDHAGIHWFELRKNALASDWTLHQDGIFGAEDGEIGFAHRWMGSAALDHMGNMGLGYSVSSSSIYPSIRYTGRLAGDPPGSMSQGEQTIVEGSGSQFSSNRWGDYSMLAVDPVDDCTFWYTQQYVQTSGSNSWKTRIGAFRFPGCSIGPQGELSGRVSDHLTSDPIEAAQISAVASITQTLATYTNPDGDYLMVAPVGVYTITVSSYGYYPQTLSGVQILSGAQTVQDFALDIAPTYVISGTVRDAQSGWPLYAKITPVGAPAAPVWNDPVSGFFSLELPGGALFNISVQAFVDGYLPISISIGPLDQNTTLDVDLSVDEITCNAPGYAFDMTPVYFNDFETDNGGASVSGVTSWTWGTVASGPGVAHSGVKGWATNLNGNYYNSENGILTLPPQDLSGFVGQNPVLSWWHWLVSEARYDFASIEASKDGGISWQTVYGPLSGEVDPTWTNIYLSLDQSYAVSNVQFRYRFTSDTSVTYAGWYIDDLMVASGNCEPQPGGLVTGNVLDENLLTGLNDATINADTGIQTSTLPTSDDPAVEDGFYTFFSPEGTHILTATYSSFYLQDQASVSVPLGSAIRQDFALKAGWLSFDPTGLSAILTLGDRLTQPLTLTNLGGAAAEFDLVELRGGQVPLGPFEQPNFMVKPFKGEGPSGEGLGLPTTPDAAPLVAGEVLQSWTPDGLQEAWATAYDPINDSVWVSSPAPLWGGTDRLVEYTVAGTPTGRTYPHSSPHSSGPADLAFNWNTGNLWIMNVNTGVANCIYEIDPEMGYTGGVICPTSPTGFSTSQRGLAYDPDTDTWFAGSWNDLMVHRFDSAGNLLSSVNTGLAISGLAYNPQTKHLFAMTNESLTRIYVLDVANNYNLLGQFTVGAGFSSYSGGGLELDCDGNLWAVDVVSNQVVQFESGESTSACQGDVAWISTDPISGTIAADDFQPIEATFDAGVAEVDQPGIYTMQFKTRENTPYLVPNLPVTMTVNPPADWGKLYGDVQSLGYCDADPHPLPGSEVQIESSSGLTWTAITDASGIYQYWVDEAGSPFTLTVSAPDHLPVMHAGIQVSAGITTTTDFNLFWQQPCLHVDPLSLDVSLKTGRVVTRTLSIENTGHADAPYHWDELDDSIFAPFDYDWLSIQPISGIIVAGADVSEALVTFDASSPGGSTPGVHTAALQLESNDPANSGIHIPITMTVLPLEYGVTISPDQAGEEIPGQTLGYAITITNTSEGITDTINLSLGSSNWFSNLDTTSVGPIPSGGVGVALLVVRIPDSVLPGQQDQVVVSAISQGDPSKTASTTITSTALTPIADLQIQKTVSSDPAWAGQPLTYTLTITNQGPTTAPNVVMIDILSTKAFYLSDDGGCEILEVALVCQLGSMTLDRTRTIQVVVAPMQTGTLVNQAVVTSEAQDLNMADNFASIIGLVLGFIHYFPWIPNP